LVAELGVEVEGPVRIAPTQLESGVWYRVLVGRYATRDEARSAMEELRARREFAFVRTVRVDDDEVSGEGS
jgi:septal ring-binding cell division protein DamX